MTNGHIQLVCDGQRPVWLHTYHDGYTSEAVNDLERMPEWVIAQSRQHRDRPNDETLPWWHMLSKDFEPGLFKQLGHFDNLCWPSPLAGLMIYRHFNRWLPYHNEDLAERADIIVHCGREKGMYTIEVVDLDPMRENSPPVSMFIDVDFTERAMHALYDQ